jgi:uncharacterized membrane protein (DUF485 family)
VQVWPQEWRLALVRVMVFIAWPVLVLVSPAALLATSAPYILIEELSPLLAVLCGVSAIVLGYLAQRRANRRFESLQGSGVKAGLVLSYSVLAFTNLTQLCLMGTFVLPG